jgi:hypothetical protein
LPSNKLVFFSVCAARVEIQRRITVQNLYNI